MRINLHVALLAASAPWSHSAWTDVLLVPSGSLQSLQTNIHAMTSVSRTCLDVQCWCTPPRFDMHYCQQTTMRKDDALQHTLCI